MNTLVGRGVHTSSLSCEDEASEGLFINSSLVMSFHAYMKTKSTTLGVFIWEKCPYRLPRSQ